LFSMRLRASARKWHPDHDLAADEEQQPTTTFGMTHQQVGKLPGRRRQAESVAEMRRETLDPARLQRPRRRNQAGRRTEFSAGLQSGLDAIHRRLTSGMQCRLTSSPAGKMEDLLQAGMIRQHCDVLLLHQSQSGKTPPKPSKRKKGISDDPFQRAIPWPGMVYAPDVSQFVGVRPEAVEQEIELVTRHRNHVESRFRPKFVDTAKYADAATTRLFGAHS